MSRDLGGTPLSLIQANQIDWSYFVRIDIASPIGTQRFTDRDLGSSATVSLDIDKSVTLLTITNGGSGYTSAPTVTIAAPSAPGTQATATATILGGAVNTLTITNPGSGYSSPPGVSFSGGGGSGAAASSTLGAQSWTQADVNVGMLDQSNQEVLSVSSLDFANIDPGLTWTTWANSPGLRDADVYIYKAWFNAGVLAGKFLAYRGKIDNQQIGQRAMLALKPHRTPWSRQTPAITIMELGARNLMPAQNETIRYGNDASRVVQTTPSGGNHPVGYEPSPPSKNPPVISTPGPPNTGRHPGTGRDPAVYEVHVPEHWPGQTS